jgi:hypothetical protein
LTAVEYEFRVLFFPSMRFSFWFSILLSIKRTFGGARRFSRRALTLGRLWTLPESNPFLQRALRVEERKRRPFLLVAVLMLCILLLNSGLWFLWSWLLATPSRHLQGFGAPYELPRALGGNILSGVALVTLFCCIFAAFFLCGSRAAQNLRREVLGGTLEQLILLPQREEHWLWLLRAQPLALSLLCFLCGLPIFTLAVLTNNWHWLDLIGLLLLFIGIGHMAPGWTPLQWQAKQNQSLRFDLRAWQEKMKAVQAEAKNNKSEAAVLETQRRLARLWEEMEPVSDTTTKEGKKRLLVGANALPGAATSGQGWRWFAWFLPFQMIGPLMALARAPGSPLRALWENFVEALPADVVELAPGFLLTWPLLIERVLLAPLPFFSFALPPICLYAPLWLARQIGGNLQLASLVSPGEIFWTGRRLKVRRVCSRWVLWCALLMVLGYAWTTCIPDATLAITLRGAPINPSWALAALATICLVIGAVVAGEALEKPLATSGKGELPASAAWREAALVAARIFVFSIGAYVAFCLLGRQPFFDVPFLQRLTPLLGTTLAYLIASFGSSTLQAALPEAQRGVCKAFVLFWTLGLALAALAHVVAGWYYKNPFTFDQAPYVLLSPFVTILALLRKDLNSGVPWWLGPLLQTVIGLALLLAAALKSFGRAPANAATAADESQIQLPAPLRWMMKTLTGIWAGITGFFEGVMEIVRRADDGIVQWSKRWGNPILTDEIARRLRREHWPLGWLVLCLIGTGFLLQAWYFMGVSLQGRFVGGLTLAVMILLGFSASLRLGLCFDRDRANGTLVFIFLTPLSEKEIAWGKLFANALYTAGSLLALLPFLMIGMILEMARGNFYTPLIGLLSLAFILSVIIYFSNCSLLGAAWARKPSQGITFAFLAGVMAQLIFVLLIGIGAFISVGFNFEALLKPSIGFTFAFLLFAFNILLAILAWNGALRLLRKQRYSDDVTSGKRTG